MVNLQKQVEGLIFIAGDEGITLKTIAQVIQQDVMIVQQLIENLNANYEDQNHAFFILQTGEHVKLVTVEAIYPTLAFYLQIKSTRQLSQSALETLAIIAYKQPITRSQIEEIRGVNCDLMIRKLISMDLIVEAGRETTPGRPFLYEVTPEFMDVFNLISLDDLPEWEASFLKEGEELFEG
ncbi:MAG: SMC-Scp complex subunit ScpB [Erysipelothrix sp.]|jgi:segregation and condensation protein B|nr:SMC-Scp complex subunit ScpB [Erysipelothrix sp.]